MDAKQKLLDTALDLFSRFGYENTGVQAICLTAEFTKPTMYHYFGSKTGLLQTLLERELDGLILNLEKSTAYQHDLPQTLNLTARTFFDYFSHQRQTAYLFLSLQYLPIESEAHKISGYYYDKINSMLRQLFELAAEDHGNMKNRQTRYSYAFQGLLFSHLKLWLNKDIELNDKTTFDLVHQFSHGIYS